MAGSHLLEARKILSDVFGYPDFRGQQPAAVESIASGNDTVVLLPTGAGKSICYQVPGLLAGRRGGGTTLVISPLIALMQDQVEALRGVGVAAAALHSHLTDFDKREVRRAFACGELEFLYCSPERALTPSFAQDLDDASVNLLAIDEAHCVSQWGHDFRPEYFRLGEIADRIEAPTIALTATATPLVVDEIGSRLGMRNPKIVRGDFSRPNLRFSVEHHRGDQTRIDSIVSALEAHGLRGSKGTGRAIVYCSTRKKVESVAKALTSNGFEALYYHAGRTPLARERAKRAFDSRRRRILVATNAFGMGIDYPDVRLLVHFQAPGSIEAYYQEAGRAGRDGDQASCILYFGLADMATQRRIGSGGTASQQETRQAALAGIESYASADAECRQASLISHFLGDLDDQIDFRCEGCDLCCDKEAAEAAVLKPITVETTALPDAKKQIIADAVDRLRRPVGKRNLAKALRGSRAKSLSRGGLLTLPEWGHLKEFDEDSIIGAVDELLAEGVLERRGQKYPTVWPAGKPVRQPSRSKAKGDGDSAAPGRRSPRGGRRQYTPITRALDNYRKRTARRLKWKPYMVFQKKAIAAIEEQRPLTIDALFRIPGLGPAKVERFGDDILELVRSNS